MLLFEVVLAFAVGIFLCLAAVVMGLCIIVLPFSVKGRFDSGGWEEIKQAVYEMIAALVYFPLFALGGYYSLSYALKKSNIPNPLDLHLF